MPQPNLTHIKRLFAVSSNQCAFPKCSVSIIENNSGKVIGEICHIKAQSPDGPRFDPSQTVEERNDFTNLILLCPNHHTVIDTDIESYSVERLTKIKKEHESNSQKELDYPEFLIQNLIDKVDISTQNFSHSNVLNGIQNAEIIQNIVNPPEIKHRKSFQDILTQLYSEESLSKVISELLNIANGKNDTDLINICRNELTGWANPPNTQEHYRIHEVFISDQDRLKGIKVPTNDEFWEDLEKNENFLKIKMFFAESVPNIEEKMNANKQMDPHFSYLHVTQKQETIFPNLSNPERTVHIFGKGTLNHEILNQIRNFLNQKILDRIISNSEHNNS